jgi:hypothetical protein
MATMPAKKTMTVSIPCHTFPNPEEDVAHDYMKSAQMTFAAGARWLSFPVRIRWSGLMSGRFCWVVMLLNLESREGDVPERKEGFRATHRRGGIRPCWFFRTS